MNSTTGYLLKYHVSYLMPNEQHLHHVNDLWLNRIHYYKIIKYVQNVGKHTLEGVFCQSEEVKRLIHYQLIYILILL